jgi:hypothetical protein
MATSVTVTNGNGELGSIQSWSIAGDDATPTVVGAVSGSTGNLTLNAVPVSESRYLNGDTVAVATTGAGTFTGTVDTLSLDTTSASITAGGLLSACNITVTAPPMYGSATLQDAYSTYIGLCFTTPPAIDFSGMTSNPTVAYEGWTGVAWDYLRNLAAATRTEIAVVNGTIVVRDIGLRTIDLSQHTDADVTITPNTQDTALTVQVVNRNTTSVASVGDFIYNYALNPSVETNATDWSYVVGTGTLTTTPVRSTAIHQNGVAAYRGVINAALIDPIIFDPYWNYSVTQKSKFSLTTVAAGSTIYASSYVYSSCSYVFASTTSVYSNIEWYNSSNVLISSTTGGSGIGAVNFSFGTSWHATPQLSATVPTGAAYGLLCNTFSVAMDYSPTGGTPSIVFGSDSILASNSPVSFFDGATGGGTWTGTTNNSVSYKANPSNTSFYVALTDTTNPNNVITANAGQVVKGTVTALGSPAALAQPVRVTTTTVGVGQYAVSGSDGLPIAAAQFEAYGGSLVVAVSATPNSIDYTFTAPATAIPGVPAPYSIAVSDGTNSYATLNIAGAGTLSSPQTLTYDTGAGNTKNPVYGPVDIPFLTTLSDTNDRAIELAAQYGGGVQTISFGLSTTDALGLGLTPGSLVTWKENIYRIISTTVEEATVQCTASARVIGSDFDTVWAGKTSNDFATVWGTAKAYIGSDFDVSPLRAA